MRLAALVLCFFALFGECLAQSGTENYVLSRSFRSSGASSLDATQGSCSVAYFDGLGRPIQQVGILQSPTGKDIVSHQNYDANGQISRSYLPFTSASQGQFQANAASLATDFYGSNAAQIDPANLARPFGESSFEASPFQRLVSYRSAGAASASSQILYGRNGNSEVKRYDHLENVPVSSSIVLNGFYDIGTLSYQQTIDENGYQSRTYKDLAGQVVLERRSAPAGFLDTYYVYDRSQHLRAVLQPQFQTTPNLMTFAFLYRLDSRKRIITQITPGADSVERIYDRFNRVALQRDGNQRGRAVWAFVKYDQQNRPILTGEINNNQSREFWQTQAYAQTSHHESPNASPLGYSLNQTIPLVADAQVLTVTYYDNYNFSLPAALAFSGSDTRRANMTGFVTASRARLLNAPTGEWLATVFYYDAHQRLIQRVRQLPNLGTDAHERLLIKYVFDLSPLVMSHTTVQATSNGTITQIKTYQYDHAERLLSVQERLITPADDRTITTAAMRYSELGHLRQSGLHSLDGQYFRRIETQTRQIRGWLAGSETTYKKGATATPKPFFGYSLSYGGMAGSYSNGNISSSSWHYEDQPTMRYGLDFSYDAANRLTNSQGQLGYTETEGNISYDANGNILSLTRRASAGVVDALTYSYSGNRLTTLTDASGQTAGAKAGNSTYQYDANGNLTYDGNTNAYLTYNHLNLPQLQSINGHVLNYQYDASGNKHQLKTDTSTVKYAGDFEYDANNRLRRVVTQNGQIGFINNKISFTYYLRDHLGNVRVVFDEKGKIRQKTDYYPFGLEISRDTSVLSLQQRLAINRYFQTGKEYQPYTAYGDFGARFLDKITTRWNGIDPLADAAYGYSPFVYANNNPLLFIDPDGQASRTVWGFDGVAHTVGDGEVKNVYQAEQGDDDKPQTIVASLVANTIKDLTVSAANTALLVAGSPLRVQGGEKFTDFSVDYSRLGRQSFAQNLRNLGNDLLDAANVVSLIGTSGAGVGLSLLAKTGVKTVITTAVVKAAKEEIKAANGIEITGFAKHGLNRAIERGVKPNAILDAVKSPLKTGNMVTDPLGRQSQRFIGRSAEVVLNPQTGKIISVNPTSTNKATKLLNILGQ